MIRYIRYAGLFVLAGELMVWVSPDLCQVEFEGRYRFADHIILGINLLAI